jgi:UDP-3-O-[3-hydroxymyristoyl] N-acetylglucosamine deacetylase / 3-hydroxyacyl-[acyl-carrier-protein] dehydratase
MSHLNQKQSTLKQSVSISGVGLHTGEQVTLTFHPADEHHGFKFRRIDLPGQPIIEADCDLVTDTSRRTCACCTCRFTNRQCTYGCNG